MTKVRVGARVARRIHLAEHAMDKAMLEAGALMTAMLESRVEASLAAEVGQTALEDIVQAISQLTLARAAVVRGHCSLAEVAEAQEIGWRLDGPYESKTEPRGRLAVVA